MKRSILCLAAVIGLVPVCAFGAVIVDDSWADGGRNNGADLLDTTWWYSTSSTAIEVSTGSLGLVSGTAGRGIHGTFAAQSLSTVGDSLTATYTFTTPATVSTSGTLSAALKVGLFDNPASTMNVDTTASSGSPSPNYASIKGYSLDMDVNLLASGAPASDLTFRERNNIVTSAQLLATTAEYTLLSSGGTVGYSIAASTSYTGVFKVTRTATGIDLVGSLSQGSTLLSTFSTSDSSPTATSFSALGFHANANAFGNTSTVGAANNGIDFTNIRIEFNPAPPVPEPTSMLLVGLAGLGLIRRR
jgi:hypothetical protein